MIGKIKISILAIILLLSVCFSVKSQNTATKYLNRYQAAYEMQDYEGAIKELLKASAIEPRNAQIYYKLGLTYEKINKFKEAVDALGKYIEMAPSASNIPEIQKKKDMLEYKMEKTDEIQEQQNFMFGTWRSDVVLKKTGAPFFVFDFIDNGGEILIKMRSNCPGFQPDFVSPTAEVRRKGDWLVFSFTSDISINPEKGKQDELQFLNSASNLTSNTELGGIFGNLATIVGSVPADAASSTVKTYVFIVKLNSDTREIEGSYRETVKLSVAGKTPKITKDDITKISLLKYFTGKAKKEYSYPKGSGIYDGDFVDSYKHGKGTFIWYDSLGKESSRYTGSWVYDKRSGTGKTTYASGASFVGSYLNDNWSNGTYTYSNGNTIKGSYTNGKIIGESKFSSLGKYDIVGTNKDGSYYGDVTFTFSSGNVYIVNFFYGVISNTISIKLKNGENFRLNFANLCAPKNEELFKKIKDEIAVIFYTSAIEKKSQEDKFKYEEVDLKLLFIAKMSIQESHYIFEDIVNALGNFRESQKSKITNSFPTVCSMLESLK